MVNQHRLFAGFDAESRFLRRLSRLRFVLELLSEREFGTQRFSRRPRTVLRIEAERISLFALMAALPHVPVAVVVGLNREQRADGRLVSERIVFRFAELVQHATFVEEDARAGMLYRIKRCGAT